ncbi:aminoacyl-tRNA hydrolase [Corynebacterium kozikiae]|uniref:aminoacyl-tRNA hydrolase n=1 Tax=Corynebacterium kozikiae TaxID=2968469 RepID=UPI00211CC341|nr:aminoacyl-tRNA hydrolase [Corynebacterium sp. 76QC2CO]
MDETFLILGLGNPGPKYEQTRHNLGIHALEELLERTDGMPAALSVHKRTNTQIAQARIAGRPVVLARTRGYMNLSGGPTKALADFFKINSRNVVALFDDLELDFGQVSAKFGGGDHGHKGLKSITQALGTKEYHKVGIGIGRPPGRMDVSSFVLKPFSRQEQQELPIICANAADAVEAILRG